MKIEFGRQFKKQYKRLSPKAQQRFKKRLMLFEGDPFHPLLNNHALGGKYAHHRSINITGDVRALYVIAKKKTVLFTAIGTHSYLY
jgi:addiction module RelE/StbE family toxin